LLLSACGLKPPGAKSNAQSDPLAPAVTRLLHAAANEDDPEQHGSYEDSIAAFGEPAVPHLAAALKDPDEKIRLAAVETLGKMHGAGVVDALLDALKDDDSEVRLAAVKAFGQNRDRRAVQPLMDQFAKDDDDQVRYECLTSLGLIGDPAASDLLVKGTADQYANVRLWSIDALCQMRDAHAPPLAVQLLQDPSLYVRKQVLYSCADAFDTNDGRQALLSLALTGEDFESTVWARRHLSTFMSKEPPAGELSQQVRAAALAAMKGPRPVLAALVLGDLKDPAATDVLIRALREDPNFYVRHHAAWELGEIGAPRAVPALIGALRDPVGVVAATAYNSLQWFSDDGDRRAAAAVNSYHGQKFDQRLPK